MALPALTAEQDAEPAEGSDGQDMRWQVTCKVAEDRSAVNPDAPPYPQIGRSPSGMAPHPCGRRRADREGSSPIKVSAAGTQNSDAAVAAEFVVAEAAPQWHRWSRHPRRHHGDRDHSDASGGQPA